ncbi:MAG: hypothetical protein AAFO84_14410, partial [Cyanobacteria bacterium J06598_1]
LASLGTDFNDAKPGEMFKTDASTSIQIRNVAGPRGDSFMPVATMETSPMVAEGHVGIYWLEALAMVLKVDEVVGILLQGENSWIGFYKPQIEHILSVYKKENSESA